MASLTSYVYRINLPTVFTSVVLSLSIAFITFYFINLQVFYIAEQQQQQQLRQGASARIPFSAVNKRQNHHSKWPTQNIVVKYTNLKSYNETQKSGDLKAAASKPDKHGVKHFVYVCPPKTGSLITRAELRRYCSHNKLNCLAQNIPCPAMRSCPLSHKDLMGELDKVFWAAFTDLRLRKCCPQMFTGRNKTIKFDGSIFHPYLADVKTKQFYLKRTHSDSLWFTIIRNPIDQFISFFNFITKTHAQLYAQYLDILRDGHSVSLNDAVEVFHAFLSRNEVDKMPPYYLQLYRTLQNIQSRILGWNGSQKSMKDVLSSLDKYDYVGITEEISNTWKGLRKKLKWPAAYLNPSKLRRPTQRTVDADLKRKILAIQSADVKLHARALIVYRQKFKNA